ncbi:MAG: hypothetical protein ACRC8B_09520 [Aeromonas sobria]|uniref:hypothetical protein n=1 Tax=Aeromonas sobria TaxID=646 RepID=UPI003F2E0B7D
MSLLWLVTPEASTRIRTRYRLLRQRHASRWAAFILTACGLLAWVIFPLENANWQ